MEYIKLEAILNDFISSTGSDFVDEDTYFQWASDCLDIIGGCDALVPQVTLLEVKNKKAKLPKNWVATDIIYEYVGNIENLQDNAENFTNKMVGTNTSFGSCSCIEVDSSCGTESPWLCTDRKRVVNNLNAKEPNFRPLYYSRNNAIPGTLEVLFSRQHAQRNSYSSFGSFLAITGKASHLLLFYFGKKLDERGFPMIPDVPEVVNAIIAYIEMKIAYTEYRAEKDNKNRNFFNDTVMLYNMAAGKARAALTAIPFDLAASLTDILTQIVPRYEERYAKFTKGHSMY